MMAAHSSHEKVFVSGSRALTQLTASIHNKLENIINEHFTVLVGDADGADKAVQTFLNNEGYRSVVVYCMDGKCRHNVGKWEEYSVDSEGKRKDFEYFAMKDLKMSEDADYGLMLWDGKSKGTLNNVLNMLEAQKKSRIYVLDKDIFQSLKSATDLHDLVNIYSPEKKSYFDKKIKFSKRITKILEPEIDSVFKKQSVG